MKPSVYIESSVVSYYTARISRDLLVAAQQAVTRVWWEHRRPLFRDFVSELVAEEVGAGDAEAAHRRLAAIRGITSLDVTPEVDVLALHFVKAGIVPRRKELDAYHVSVAAVHGIDYLVTWNCSHIANAEMRGAIGRMCEEHGYRIPTICTPQELMGVES
jgi:hypothetical protein